MREVSWPPGRYAFILSAPSSVMAIAAPRGLSVPALLGSLLGLGLGLGVAGTNAGSSPAVAIPRLDLTPYPAAPAGQRRWVIQLPGVLRPSADPVLSPNPADWRVELLIGRQVDVDCNLVHFGGKVRSESLKGWGTKIYRVSDVGPLASTRMACPPGSVKQGVFVPMGGMPFVVPYSASLPIVVYAPGDLEVRWRLWKAEKQQRPATVL
jgi:ecotin